MAETSTPQPDEVEHLLLNARLRDELKFDDLPALVAQMHLDARQARDILQNDTVNRTRAYA